MTMMPQQGQLLPPGAMMLWIRVHPLTGLQYGKTMDGRMVYQKADGDITVYRPQKPIVLGRNPRASTLNRAARRLKVWQKAFKYEIKVKR